MPSFPIRLFINWIWNTKSIETNLGRWALLVIAVINADAYPFMSFSDQIYHIKDAVND